MILTQNGRFLVVPLLHVNTAVVRFMNTEYPNEVITVSDLYSGELDSNICMNASHSVTYLHFSRSMLGHYVTSVTTFTHGV
jgi:hypothetical protein